MNLMIVSIVLGIVDTKKTQQNIVTYVDIHYEKPTTQANSGTLNLSGWLVAYFIILCPFRIFISSCKCISRAHMKRATKTLAEGGISKVLFERANLMQPIKVNWNSKTVNTDRKVA